MSANIVLVDDDKNLLVSLSVALKAENFAVESYADSSAALEAMKIRQPDLAILDITMPGMDGTALLGQLRRISSVPVIILSARSGEIDEILGLKMGADDYIRKPFFQRVLIERVRTVLRRANKTGSAIEDDDGEVLIRGDLRLDMSRHECSWKKNLITLTVTEFNLLRALVYRLGHVKDRDQLMDEAYGESIYVTDRTIDSHIKRIRRKLKSVDREFTGIRTLYGVGYQFQT